MADTAVSSEQLNRQKNSVRRFFIVVVALATSIGTISLAWPRLIAGVTEDPVEEILSSLSLPNPPTQAMLDHALVAKEHAVQLHPTAKAWNDIGLLDLKESLRLGSPLGRRKIALDASIAAHEASLALDPNNAYAWTRLGQGLLVRDGANVRNLGPILNASIMFAPYDSRLVIARVDMALAAWDRLSASDHQLMNEQIQLAARQSPTALANITKQRLALTRVVESLTDHPSLLKRFVYAYIYS